MLICSNNNKVNKQLVVFMHLLALLIYSVGQKFAYSNNWKKHYSFQIFQNAV